MNSVGLGRHVLIAVSLRFQENTCTTSTPTGAMGGELQQLLLPWLAAGLGHALDRQSVKGPEGEPLHHGGRLGSGDLNQMSTSRRWKLSPGYGRGQQGCLTASQHC